MKSRRMTTRILTMAAALGLFGAVATAQQVLFAPQTTPQPQSTQASASSGQTAQGQNAPRPVPQAPTPQSQTRSTPTPSTQAPSTQNPSTPSATVIDTSQCILARSSRSEFSEALTTLTGTQSDQNVKRAVGILFGTSGRLAARARLEGTSLNDLPDLLEKLGDDFEDTGAVDAATASSAETLFNAGNQLCSWGLPDFNPGSPTTPPQGTPSPGTPSQGTTPPQQTPSQGSTPGT